MKKIHLLTFIFIFTIITQNAFAQKRTPTRVSKAVYSDKSNKLSDTKAIPLGKIKSVFKDRLVPNKFDFHEELINSSVLEGPDPVLQSTQGRNRFDVEINDNFSGIYNTYSVAPPDTDGDVSLNHYMQMVNNGFAIWDKDGNLLYGPAHSITLWEGFEGPWSGTNDGDPIVVFDEYAGRWVASQFSLPFRPSGPFYELVAVSATDDPTGEWYRYAFEFEHMPDYPKFGVWTNGYYFTINQFVNASSWAGAGVVALDREAMKAGDPDAQMIFFDLGESYGSLLPSDADGVIPPPDGAPAYFVNMGNDILRVWETEIDWENTNNSTINLVTTIPTQSFASQNISIEQPGTSQELATLAGRLMFRLQYRNFIDYEVMVTNHTVNAGSGRAGVRWYELRKYDDEWEMYQQGTYAPDDGENRWMGSVAMNEYGDIAVGYSVSSSNTYPSIRIAGQSAANTGTGILNIAETSIYEGQNSQTGVNRWGDYAKMSVDPTNNQSFWFTTEYSNGGWDWATQIASFSFTQLPNADFTVDEILIPVGESVNFTDLSVGIPTGWEWTFEGAEIETSNLQNPTDILYPEEGVFPVTMIAINEIGSDTITKLDYIEVSSTILPLVEFTASDNFVCTGEPVQFTDQTQFSPINWQWQFDPPTVRFINGTDENSQHPEVIFDEVATYEVTLTAWNLNGSSSTSKVDYLMAGGYLPFFKETFEDGLDAKNWTVDNPDEGKTWELFNVGGSTPGNKAAAVNFRKYFVIGARDRLITPMISLEGLNSAYLTFTHSYAKRLDEVSDSLIIYVSGDCGETWTRVFADAEDGSGNFATHPQTDYDFWPETGGDWCLWGWGASCIDVDLSPWAGENNVQIAFETYSFYGNPIFIDNIVISQYVGEEELRKTDEVNIYPNPTIGKFTINLPADHSYTELTITDQLGKEVYTESIAESTNTIEIDQSKKLTSGVYIINFNGKNMSHAQKLIIK
jgi:PKD repeat protein